MTEPTINYPRLADYSEESYDRGRNRLWQAAWLLVQSLAFSSWWFPRKLRPPVLRAFGATIGSNVVIRHNVRVQWPWKLIIGDHSWVGEDSWLYNAGELAIGSDVCLSQGVYICAGDHDRAAANFAPRPGPITIEDGAWLATQCMILKDVTIGTGAVVGGRAIVAHDLAPGGTARTGAVH